MFFLLESGDSLFEGGDLCVYLPDLFRRSHFHMHGAFREPSFPVLQIEEGSQNGKDGKNDCRIKKKVVKRHIHGFSPQVETDLPKNDRDSLYNFFFPRPIMTQEKDPVSEDASGNLSWMIAHLLEMESLKKRTRLRTGANGSPEAEMERLLWHVPTARKSALSSLASGLLDKAKRLGLKMIHPGSEDYPLFLRRLSVPPFCVWVQGDSDVPSTLSIGMVGAREAGIRAQEGFFDLAREIVSLGWTVVSGLAKGMDGAAHRGALAGQGKTVGVVGTGLDRVYPAEHLSLAREICARGGALLSEFSPGDGPEGWHFPHRNRMIVGLSFALIVGAHRRRSGTYITARIALEEGREIFVFDRGATGWEKEGPEMLLGEGARRIDNAWDVVRALVPETSQQTSEESDCER